MKAGAGYGERSPNRVTQRNGYRSRNWDTRVGTAAYPAQDVFPGALRCMTPLPLIAGLYGDLSETDLPESGPLPGFCFLFGDLAKNP